MTSRSGAGRRPRAIRELLSKLRGTERRKRQTYLLSKEEVADVLDRCRPWQQRHVRTILWLFEGTPNARELLHWMRDHRDRCTPAQRRVLEEFTRIFDYKALGFVHRLAHASIEEDLSAETKQAMTRHWDHYSGVLIPRARRCRLRGHPLVDHFDSTRKTLERTVGQRKNAEPDEPAIELEIERLRRRGIPLRKIQMRLEAKGLIRHKTWQAFHKWLKPRIS
jgi:hypothetical protein